MNITSKERGKILREARKRKKLTLDEIGKRIGVCRSTILRWERGDIERINTAVLKVYADVLSIPLNKLILDEEKFANASELKIAKYDYTIEVTDEERQYIELFRKASRHQKLKSIFCLKRGTEE